MVDLIGITGQRGSGKDQAYSFIQEWADQRGLKTARRGFADKLKHSAMLALGFDVTEEDAVVLADSLKELGEITTVIPDQSVMYTIDGRKFLQLYGVEAHRDIFGEWFWVDALLPFSQTQWRDNFPDADVAVVTDVRFPNEALRIHALTGIVIEVHRPGLAERDSHSSEARLDASHIDYVIDNSGDLDDLRAMVFSVMDRIYDNTFITDKLAKEFAYDKN